MSVLTWEAAKRIFGWRTREEKAADAKREEEVRAARCASIKKSNADFAARLAAYAKAAKRTPEEWVAHMLQMVTAEIEDLQKRGAGDFVEIQRPEIHHYFPIYEEVRRLLSEREHHYWQEAVLVYARSKGSRRVAVQFHTYRPGGDLYLPMVPLCALLTFFDSP